MSCKWVAALGCCERPASPCAATARPAGLVSYGPAAYGKVWSIVGGNRQLVSGLLAVSGATVMTNSRVSLVRQLDDGRYVVEVRAPEAHRAAGSEPPWPGAEDGNCSEQDAEEKPDDGPAVGG